MLLAYSAHAFLFLEKRIFRCSWPNVLAIKMQWPAVAHRFSSFDVSAENVTDSTFISLSITPWLPVDLRMAHYLSRIVDLFLKKVSNKSAWLSSFCRTLGRALIESVIVDMWDLNH